MGSQCAEMDARARMKTRTFSRLPTRSRFHMQFAISGGSCRDGLEARIKGAGGPKRELIPGRGRSFESNVVTEVQGQADADGGRRRKLFPGSFLRGNERKRPQFVTFRATFPIDNFCQQTYDSRYPSWTELFPEKVASHPNQGQDARFRNQWR